MTYRSNMDFVADFVNSHEFFTVCNQLYVIKEKAIVVFESEDMRHYISSNYQTFMNRLAPSSSLLSDNIKSRVLASKPINFLRKANRILKDDLGYLYNFKDNKIARIDENGYRIQDRIEMKAYNLIDTDAMKSQVLPVQSSNDLMSMIQELTNFESKDDLKLFIGWLVSTFVPDIQTPILVLLGEQGSGKSYLSKIIKRIVDPSLIEKQFGIKSVQDLAIVMEHSYLTVLDNLSSISNDISDALCQTVTSGQFTTRKLYSNNELVVLNLDGKVIVNGISIINTKPDLLERSIVIELKKLDEKTMKSESTLNKLFESFLPFILHEIFEILSKSLSIIDDVRLDEKPRLADFSKHLVAISSSIGLENDAILESYLSNIEKVSDIVPNITLFDAILEIIESDDGKFVGTSTELLKKLKTTKFSGLPKAPNKLSYELKRVESNLRKKSITVTRHKDRKGSRIISIRQETADTAVD